MVMAGLLWYDDDGRRPLTAKIIEAIERYRERVGFEPTVCQLPPQQLAILTAAANQSARPKRSKARVQTPAVELPRALRLEPDEHLHPNYFLLGMGEDDLTIPLALEDDDAPPKRMGRMKRPAPLAKPSTRKPAIARASKTAAATSSQTPQPAQFDITQPTAPAPSAKTSARPARHPRAAEATTTAASDMPPNSRRQASKAATQMAKSANPATAKGEQATSPVTAKKVAKLTKSAKPAKPAPETARVTAKAGKSAVQATARPAATNPSAPTPAKTTAAKAAKTPAQAAKTPATTSPARAKRAVTETAAAKPTKAATAADAKSARPGKSAVTQPDTRVEAARSATPSPRKVAAAQKLVAHPVGVKPVKAVTPAAEQPRRSTAGATTRATTADAKSKGTRLAATLDANTGKSAKKRAKATEVAAEASAPKAVKAAKATRTTTAETVPNTRIAGKAAKSEKTQKTAKATRTAKPAETPSRSTSARRLARSA